MTVPSCAAWGILGHVGCRGGPSSSQVLYCRVSCKVDRRLSVSRQNSRPQRIHPTPTHTPNTDPKLCAVFRIPLKQVCWQNTRIEDTYRMPFICPLNPLLHSSMRQVRAPRQRDGLLLVVQHVTRMDDLEDHWTKCLCNQMRTKCAAATVPGAPVSGCRYPSSLYPFSFHSSIQSPGAALWFNRRYQPAHRAATKERRTLVYPDRQTTTFCIYAHKFDKIAPKAFRKMIDCGRQALLQARGHCGRRCGRER